jgi:hypothetical protein
MRMLYIKGGFLDFFFLCTIFNTASSAVSEDAEIEPRTVATTALAVTL